MLDYTKRGRRAPQPQMPPVPEGETPVVEATRAHACDGSPLLIVRQCPFCGERHVHGAVGPNRGDGDGLRRSHCFDFKLRRDYALREIMAAPNANAESRE